MVNGLKFCEVVLDFLNAVYDCIKRAALQIYSWGEGGQLRQEWREWVEPLANLLCAHTLHPTIHTMHPIPYTLEPMPNALSNHLCAPKPLQGYHVHNKPHGNPYRRPMPQDLWWSWGGGAFL